MVLTLDVLTPPFRTEPGQARIKTVQGFGVENINADHLHITREIQGRRDPAERGASSNFIPPGGRDRNTQIDSLVSRRRRDKL